MDLQGRPWTEYYAARAQKPEPRPLLVQTLTAHAAAGLKPGRAVDLGCDESSAECSRFEALGELPAAELYYAEIVVSS